MQGAHTNLDCSPGMCLAKGQGIEISCPSHIPHPQMQALPKVFAESPRKESTSSAVSGRKAFYQKHHLLFNDLLISAT